MSLELKKPLAIFDIEATGLDITMDRIVEIAILKIDTNQSETFYCKRINPEMDIPKESIAIHGISNEDVANAPTLKEVVSEIEDFIGNADLVGYNSNKFDVPMLAEELLRVGSNFDINARKLIDVQNIFHKMEKRTLEAAYTFYCGKDLKDAHSAEADTKATYEVLLGQLERYKNDLENNVDFLATFSRFSDKKNLDFAGRIAINNDGEAVYNFGKHKGKTIKEIHKTEPGYYGWMLNSNFPRYTKEVLKKEMEKIKNKHQEQSLDDKLNALKHKFNK